MKQILQKGFTLIELLVVIAILGVLATILLAAVNPVEQLARARDSSRKNDASQLVNAMSAYYTSQGAVLPTANATWITTLVNAGEIKAAPTTIAYNTASKNSTVCTTNAQSNICDAQGSTATDYAIYVRMESSSEWNKCTSAAGATNTGANAYWLYSSKDAKAGIVCMTGEPSAANITAGGFGTTASGVYGN